MTAEQNFFAQKEMQQVKASQIVSVTTPVGVAKLVHEELPLHFAHRMKHMESLNNWQKCEELVSLHEVFSNSFRQLRLVEPSDSSLPEYSEVIRTLRGRHKDVVPLLGQAVQRLYREGFMGEKALNAWVDTFMTSRIATEMLTSHFVAITEAETSMNTPDASAAMESWWGPVLVPEESAGIVDIKCDPAKVCMDAARIVQNTFPNPWFPDVKVPIEVEKAVGSTEIGFCYISKYLFFIIEELLKNSARAVIESSNSAEELSRKSIKVTVCADERNVAISICDKGGGIRSDNLGQIWSYAYSNWNEQTDVPQSQGSPVGGVGMGLPLTRLYVGYLGGSLDICNMPGIGVDTYLFLNRIEIDDKN